MSYVQVGLKYGVSDNAGPQVAAPLRGGGRSVMLRFRSYPAPPMRARLLAATRAALLVPAASARAGDPIMPLGEVASGMQCTGYSVVRGTEVVPFDIEVVDVIDDRTTGTGPRIMVRASGPAVDETGIGPGFSGSPIYCPGAGGPRVIGAISEAIGEYGGKVFLATPIESILGAPVDPPVGPAS